MSVRLGQGTAPGPKVSEKTSERRSREFVAGRRVACEHHRSPAKFSNAADGRGRVVHNRRRAGSFGDPLPPIAEQPWRNYKSRVYAAPRTTRSFPLNDAAPPGAGGEANQKLPLGRPPATLPGSLRLLWQPGVAARSRPSGPTGALPPATPSGVTELRRRDRRRLGEVSP